MLNDKCSIYTVPQYQYKPRHDITEIHVLLKVALNTITLQYKQQ